MNVDLAKLKKAVVIIRFVAFASYTLSMLAIGSLGMFFVLDRVVLHTNFLGKVLIIHAAFIAFAFIIAALLYIASRLISGAEQENIKPKPNDFTAEAS